ncbi:hypothetical protein ABXJ56_12535 [Microbacterium chocolatum]|uniref:hypothetical protein n=1 Tax=Microbacterium aurantiacum TaxID=162393 RepID=UPI00338E6C33
MTAPIAFCRSRSEGRRCTRPAGHAGLHRHRTILWSEVGADPARCAGSGARARAADALDDGWPHGRALCRRCLRFIPLVEGTLVVHETGGDSAEEHRRVAEWFNTHGW